MSTSDDDVRTVPHDEQVDGAVMLSFGAVHPGRERLAVELFTEVGRYLGRLLAEHTITNFRPYFFADGSLGDISGFFVVEGHRDRLDTLRREESFQRLVLKVGAAVANVRVHSLVAGSDAGRLVNLYREIRTELGLM